MTQILEATMLLCFGCSWPIAVFKNIRAHSAKGMSLQFILLIMVGYIAGIAAKIYSHTINYVLLVYVFNLLVVSANLVIYFVNLNSDHRAAARMEAERMARIEHVEGIADSATKQAVESYEKLNEQAVGHGVVLFGGEYFSKLPLGDLIEHIGPETPVYNRSIDHLRIDDAPTAINECVAELAPERVFLNIGDADAQDPTLNLDHFIDQYRWLLYSFAQKCSARVFIVALTGDAPAAAQINARLKKLARESGYDFIEASRENMMHEIRCCAHGAPADLADAMRLAG